MLGSCEDWPIDCSTKLSVMAHSTYIEKISSATPSTVTEHQIFSMRTGKKRKISACADQRIQFAFRRGKKSIDCVRNHTFLQRRRKRLRFESGMCRERRTDHLVATHKHFCKEVFRALAGSNLSTVHCTEVICRRKKTKQTPRIAVDQVMVAKKESCAHQGHFSADTKQQKQIFSRSRFSDTHLIMRVLQVRGQILTLDGNVSSFWFCK